MRLICPNCDAEYEVDDAAIPQEGRDVQCSACGHAWFQAHPEVEAEAEAEAELYQAPEVARGDEPEVQPEETFEEELAQAVAEEPSDEGAVTQAEAQADMATEPEAAIVSPAADPEGDEEDVPATVVTMPSAATRHLDETVLAVLKEEAAREVTARRAEDQDRPGLESQTEMPLSAATPAAAAAGSMAAAVKRIAKLRGLATDEGANAEEPAAEAVSEPQEPTVVKRKTLPAIEEINQSLRSAGDRGKDAGDAAAGTLTQDASRGGGFRRSFVALVGLAALIVILYTLAPIIAANVPALEGAAKAYVGAVDAGRIALDGALQGLIGWLQSLMGSQNS